MASRLAASPITPNQISVASLAVAAVGGALIACGGSWLAWLLAALCVQLRLLCNLLDGMVAVEGGKATATGPLFNELPDRIADSLLLVPVGYAAGAPWLGWAAALLAALTAYIRVLGGSLGLAQSFAGVMAKQRRMAVLTAGLVAQAIETWFGDTRYCLLVVGIAIVAGSLATCMTRTAAIARQLTAR
ncbi:CDP-alcohol phosphatidyltransferase family protein [Defluviicoccus vanus]|uniref:CDP-alcohol phosphatidyltransferase family protein n=1 Tax=Defluviicoccus vanus TaxID=111831 RepID=A0A7H1N6R8_9PROT|nr:CDP-alcohol phosphatidyltransferase family protein [Defluviicoccus vanus]